MMSIAKKMVILFYVINGFLAPCDGHHISVQNSDSLISDTTFFPFNDTVVHPGPLRLPETNVTDTSKRTDSTKVNHKKSKLKEEMMHLILAPGEGSKKSTNKSNGNNGNLNYYQQYQGKIIRSIKFKQMEVFGQSVSDTNKVPKNWLEKLGNGLHVSTQKRILKNRLLEHPGDPLTPLTLSDNERLIREMPSIEDVRIYAKESKNSPDSVDLQYVTKDVWPVGFSLDLYDVEYGRLGMWNKNLLGLGNEFYYWLTWDYNRYPNYSHKFRYRIHNIGNTFISADAWYENSWSEESYKLYLNRDFFTPQTKFAGGAGFEHVMTWKDIALPDSVLPNQYINYDHYDLWLGRAILLKNRTEFKLRKSIAFTARIANYNFRDRPAIGPEFLYDYHKRTSILASFGYSEQAFTRSRLIYGFGRSEDISYGSLLFITAGVDLNEYTNRPYASISYSKGILLKNLGYFYQSAAFGSFFYHGIQQGMLTSLTKYYTPLLNRLGHYKYRFFAMLKYEAGFHRFSDEFLEFNKIDGIRGLDGTRLRGDQRVNVNFESDCYSPQKIMGFKFTYFAFLDAGIITNSSETLFKNPLYSGIGIGVRIRNEHLVFNTLQIRLAYYPYVPSGVNAEYLQVAGLSDVKPESFSLPKPEIMVYQVR